MNHHFVNLVDSHAGQNKLVLHAELAAIAVTGIVAVDGVYLLGSTANTKTNATRDSLQDKTGFECFINCIHIDDFASEHLFQQSIQFASAILQAWKDRAFKGIFNSIVSIDDGGATVRFHMVRPNESWLANDIDRYEEAVLEVSSLDAASLDRLLWPSNATDSAA